MVYALGARWFGRAAGALAALLLITRVPVLSYGVRAYIDVPYLLLVLAPCSSSPAVRGAGWPVLALLALAGLLRPEAWAFSGLYWLYLIVAASRSSARTGGSADDADAGSARPRSPGLRAPGGARRPDAARGGGAAGVGAQRPGDHRRSRCGR